jgi:hypothetical protein
MATNSTEFSATLLSALRKICPAKVRVFDAADGSRDIAISGNRNKWSQAMVAIDARPWVRCELLDKTGSVLGYVEHDGPAGELEDITGSEGKESRALERQMKIMLEAQRVALTFRDKETTELLKGVGDILRVNTEAIKQLTVLYQSQVAVASDVASMQATAAAGGDMQQWIDLINASPQLASSVVPLLKFLLAKNPQPPTTPTTPTTKKPPHVNGTGAPTS